MICGRLTLNPAASDETAGPAASSSPSIISRNLDTASAAPEELGAVGCGSSTGGVASV